MMSALIRFLKRLRETYYFSLVVSGAARPLYRAGSWSTRQLETKIRKNGTSVRLPNGQQMRVARDSGISLASTLFWHGMDGHEPETSQLLMFFFERSSVFLDVGANYGFYSLLAALWNQEIRVVAFEPLAPIFEALRRNVALNQLQRRVTCENMALSSQSGKATIYLPRSEGKDLESTGTLSANSWQARKHAEEFEIKAVRFDDYEKQHPMRVDLIKIDVEDFEAEVLAGMADVIRRDRPFIVCEILARNREHKNESTRRILEQLGYTAYWITGAGLIRVSRFDFERRFQNFLLAPVAAGHEIVSDPNVLWEARRAGAGGNLVATGN